MRVAVSFPAALDAPPAEATLAAVLAPALRAEVAGLAAEVSVLTTAEAVLAAVVSPLVAAVSAVVAGSGACDGAAEGDIICRIDAFLLGMVALRRSAQWYNIVH